VCYVFPLFEKSPRVYPFLEAAIVSDTEKPDLLQIQSQGERHLTKSPSISPHPIVSFPYTNVFELLLIRRTTTEPTSPDVPSAKPGSSFPPQNHADSATESDNDGPYILGKGKRGVAPGAPDLSPTPFPHESVIPSRISPPPAPAQVPTNNKGPSSDSESSPLRPAKKAKPRISSSDDDSEEERKKRVAQLKSGTGGAKRGTRQPIKRGGRRF
jgi:hypothetical protein